MYAAVIVAPRGMVIFVNRNPIHVWYSNFMSASISFMPPPESCVASSVEAFTRMLSVVAPSEVDADVASTTIKNKMQDWRFNERVSLSRQQPDISANSVAFALFGPKRWVTLGMMGGRQGGVSSLIFASIGNTARLESVAAVSLYR
jgi:hypothetical protein